jgi:hypothetical protein
MYIAITFQFEMLWDIIHLIIYHQVYQYVFITFMPCSHIFGGSHIFVASFPVANDSSCLWLDAPKAVKFSQTLISINYYRLINVKCQKIFMFFVNVISIIIFYFLIFIHYFQIHSNKKEAKTVYLPKNSSPPLMPNLKPIWARAT